MEAKNQQDSLQNSHIKNAINQKQSKQQDQNNSSIYKGQGQDGVIDFEQDDSSDDNLDQTGTNNLNNQTNLDQQEDEQLSPINYQKKQLEDGQQAGQELKSPEKKLKRKVDLKEKQKFLGIKEDPLKYESQAGEYFNINMDHAIQYVITKSKAFKDKVESEYISNEFLKEYLIDNKHFSLSYNSYLQRLCNKKLLHPEFKSVPKKTMLKLEKFFIERLDKCIESHNINKAYIEKANYIQNCFDARIAELKEKIKQKDKLILN